MPAKWTGASVLAIALGAGAAGWAMASWGKGSSVPGLLPRGQKILLDTGRKPRFATIKEMEKVCSAAHESGTC